MKEKLYLPRAEMPVEIRNEMEAYRWGMASFPKSYNEFHKNLAEQTLKHIQDNYAGLVVHRTWQDRDGWGDGHRALFVIVEYRDELFKLNWSDGNQGFMVQSSTGGRFSINCFDEMVEERRDAKGLYLKHKLGGL